jgi:hypothetical protein
MRFFSFWVPEQPVLLPVIQIKIKK